MKDLSGLYDEIRHIIESKIGEAGEKFSYGKFDGLGWLNFHYTCSTYDGLFPRISLKQQKNAVHIYVMMWKDGRPLLENYVNVFGKSAIGKGCLRIKKLNEEFKKAICEIIDYVKGGK